MELNQPPSLFTGFAKEIADYVMQGIRKELAQHALIAEDTEKLLSQTEAASYLKVTMQTINNYERQVTINAIRKVPGFKPLYSLNDLKKMCR